jgi:hypothetical protein
MVGASYKRGMILRILLALVALHAAPLALAQQAPRIPAPEHHQATGLTFPQRIGPAEKSTSVDYAKTDQKPDLGYAWNYIVPGQVGVTIYLYRPGDAAIPSGAGNPVVLAQFEQAYRDIQAMAKLRHAELKPVAGPTDCGRIFRCITLSRIEEGNQRRADTTLMVTGYQGYFLKIRSTAVSGPQGEAAVADFLSSFLSQLR